MMNAISLRQDDIRLMDGEPRVKDLRLGEVLGFAKPISVRKVIRKNAGELAMHGGNFSNLEKFSGQRRGPASEVYYLNEAQALLVCMFARTNEAIAARKQIIEVFLAYRHGKLVPTGRKPPANDRDKPWSLMEQRIKRLEKLMAMQDKVETEAFARAVAYVPTILYLEGPDGKRKRQHRPRWWYDREVREGVIACHRQMTIGIATESLKAKFGKDRAPSRSSIGRFWVTLDEVRAAS